MRVYMLCDEVEAEKYVRVVQEDFPERDFVPRHYERRNVGQAVVICRPNIPLKEVARRAKEAHKSHIVQLHITDLCSAVAMIEDKAILAATYPDQYIAVYTANLEECWLRCS